MKRKTLKLALAAGIALLLPAIAVWSGRLDLSQIKSALGYYSSGQLGLGLLIVFVQMGLQASRLWALLPCDSGMRWGSTFSAFTAGQLLNQTMPLRVGDLAKVSLLSRVQNGKTFLSNAGTVLVADKTIDIISLIILLLLTNFAAIENLVSGLQVTTMVQVGTAILLGAALLYPWIPARAADQLRRLLRMLSLGTATLLDIRKVSLALAFSIGAWLSECFLVEAFTEAAGYELLLKQSLWVLVVLNLGIAIPVSAANIGTFEGAMAFGLTQAGVPPETSLGVGLVYHGCQMSGPVILTALTSAPKMRKVIFNREQFHARDRHKTRAIGHFDGLAHRYEESVGYGALSLLRERERAAVLELAGFSSKQNQSVIDVGSGTGIYALAAKRAGCHVSAMDIAPAMVERLKPHVDRAYLADVDNLEHESQYDVVVCAGVLDFVINPERSFRNLAALVKPGGRMVLLAPRSGVFGFVYRIEKRFIGIEVNLYSLDWFKGQARDHQLTLVEQRYPLPTNQAVLFTKHC